MRKMVLLFVLLISLTSFSSFAQYIGDKNWPDIRFGKIKNEVITTGDILSNPRLTDMKGVWTVKSFTITFLPKGHDMYGPYSTKGSALTADEIAIIKKLKGTTGKIIIDDIKASGEDGAIRSLVTIVLNYDY